MDSEPLWNDVADKIIAEPDEDTRKAILASYHDQVRTNLETVIKARINKHIGVLEKLQAGEKQ